MSENSHNRLHENRIQFELDEQDREMIVIVTRFTESILEKMPGLKTKLRANQAVGLGRALKCFAHLPEITPGISLKYGIYLSGRDGPESPISAKRYWNVEIKEKLLLIQTGTSRHNSQKYNDTVSAEDIPDFDFETLNFHYGIWVDGNRDFTGNFSDWEDEIEDALNGGFTLFVEDQCNEKLLPSIHSPGRIIEFLETLGVISADESNKALRYIQSKI